MRLPSPASGSRLVLDEGKGPKEYDAICIQRKP